MSNVQQEATRGDGGRVRTGVPGLDELVGGGFPAKRAVVVCGGPGSGKTIFGLQFLAAGLARGESGVFVSVDQKPRHLIEDAAAFGWDLQAQAARSTLAILDASPYFTSTNGRSWQRSGLDARQVAADLMQQVSTIKARRLVIDTMTSLVPHDMDRAQAQNYLRSLVHSLEDSLGAAILLTCRGVAADPQGSCDALRYLTSGVLELRLRERGDRLERTLAIRKMRGAAVPVTSHAVAIEPGRGLSIAGAEAVDSAARPFASAVRAGAVDAAALRGLPIHPDATPAV